MPLYVNTRMDIIKNLIEMTNETLVNSYANAITWEKCERRNELMKYEVILEKEEYALILRGSRMEEYAVVNGLNNETGEWAWTCCYYNFSEYTRINKIEALFLALDYFREKTQPNYIPRCRLEELATQFKDGLIEDDEESAMEYFDEVCEMSESEKEFFGIETESEEE